MVTQPTIRQSPGLKEIEKPATNFLSFRNVILSFTVLAVVVLIATLISMGKKDRAATDASQVSVPAAAAPTTPETAVPTKAPEVAAKVETPAQPSAAVAAKAIPIVAVATAPEKTSTGVKKFHAELHATESTWVNVRIDNGNSKGTLIKTGASLPIEADEKVTLVISNAANVEIRWNGNWYSAPGTRGEVKSITLPDQLESLKPKSAGKKPSSTASATPKVKKTPEPASVTATPATPAAAADVAPPND